MSTYHTTFLIKWPEHLGGEATQLSFAGSMTLLPLMGTV